MQAIAKPPQNPPVMAPRPLCQLISLVAICSHLVACHSEPLDLSQFMVNDAQAITSIIKEHLDLRNGSTKNCGKVAGKLLGYVETHKTIRLGLEERLAKLSLVERKQLRARLARRRYGAMTARLKLVKEQFLKQCPVRAAAIESLIGRISRGQPVS